MSIQTIKNAIKSNLDDLVTANVLGGATITSIKKSPLSSDVGTFPHAFLMPPAVDSEVLDNRTNVRTYSFDIMILFQAEDISDTADLEVKIESMLSKFDNDPTLGGTALAPASRSAPVRRYTRRASSGTQARQAPPPRPSAASRGAPTLA